MRVVLLNTPWARARIHGIDDWWQMGLVFDDIIDVTLPYIPFQASSDNSYQAVLDSGVINKYKKGMTLFVTPFTITPKDKNGLLIQGRTVVNGLFVPPAFFLGSPTLVVSTNETDHIYVNGVDEGPDFEWYARHEFSHFYFWDIQKFDDTHTYFNQKDATHPVVQWAPEKARDEVYAVLKPTPAPPTPVPPAFPPKINLWAQAIQKFEGWYPGSKSYINNNPGNCRDINGDFLKFPTYDAGFSYLEDYLNRACTGKHPAYKPTMSILQAMHIYTSDPEPVPTNYANACALKIGVPVDTLLSALV